MYVQPYLNFDGRCDEAIEFYTNALGANLQFLMRFKDNPDPNASSPGVADKVMHAALRIGDTVLFASDGRCDGKSTFKGIMLSLGVSSDADAENYFAALSEGGQVSMPMSATFFASKFGMVTDAFGVSWMVINPLEQ